MKSRILLALSMSLVALLTYSCVKPFENLSSYEVGQEYVLDNVKYGNHNRQRMDVYLPKDRDSETTKLIVLIHGGAWAGGKKQELSGVFNNLQNLYPDHAIINMEYRLGTANNPGFPKQINAIQAALDEVRKPKYNISEETFIFGVSAGAHLGMLYAYGYDNHGYVKALANMVGPADLTDPEFQNYSLSLVLVKNLLGNKSYNQDPELWEQASPVYHITENAPKTLSFYGDSDQLIPPTQMDILHDKLDEFGVYNEKTMYEGEDHGGWSEENTADFAGKLNDFIFNHFNY